MEKKTVLVGMSGGVDSAAAAALLAEAGYRPVGCTLRLYGNEELGLEREGGCCSLEDVEDAASMASFSHFSIQIESRSCTWIWISSVSSSSLST